MRQAAGQVAREAHRAAHYLLGLVTLLLLALAVLGWRLAQGPVQVAFLARAIEQHANAAPGENRLEVGSASVGWAGWREGRLSPLELRLSQVRLRGPDGAPRAELPDAAIALSLPWLLRGEVAPSRLELYRPVLRLRRGQDGAMDIALMGPAAPAEAAPAPSEGGAEALQDLLARMMRPPDEATPLGALAWVGITGARVMVEDEALGVVWSLEEAGIEIRRLPAGGLSGRGTATLRLGGERVALAGTAEAGGDPAAILLRLVLPAVRPAALAGESPALAPLAGLDAPARIELTTRLGLDGAMLDAGARLQASAGALDLGAGRRIPIAGAEAALRWRPDAILLDQAAVRLAGPGTPTFSGLGEVRRVEGRWRAAAQLELDALPIEALGRWWPEGLGAGDRAWILANVTAGTAREGRWWVEAESAGPLSGLQVTGLAGSLQVSEATVHWLRPIPPIERVSGEVGFSLSEVVVRGAEGRQGRALQAREAVLRFLFPAGAVPQADLQIGLAGPVPELLALLQHPRLRLFDSRPMPLKEPQGSVEGRVQLAFPLVADLPVEQLRVRAQAQLRQVRLADVLAGRPLERGQLELAVDNDGLRVNGTATLAEIPARVGVEMDFRAGPPTQVVMRETVQARAAARQLAAIGLAAEEHLDGPVGLEVRTERRRNGTGRAQVRAELREAAMAIDMLGWRKPPGQPAAAEAVLRLGGDALEAVESFRIEAPALLLRGNAVFGAGTRLQRVTINEGRVHESRFGGESRPPQRPGAPWMVTLRGPVLDLRRTLGEDDQAPPAAAAAGSPPEPSGPPVAVDGRFERVLLGERRELAQVEARVVVDGRGVVRQGQLSGRAGPRGRFEVDITPQGQGRAMRLTAEDAGALLGSFDVVRHVEGGRLSVTAAYAHNGPGAPLSGTAEMTDFAVREAPGFAKLLQAMTLYGLVEALAGPGLGFSRLVAPFTLTPEALALDEARAFSASLGLTAKGTLDRRRRRLNMEGTIVPAYMFNAMLGNLPIVGRLFSPETGGGLFAAIWWLRGPVDDPQVGVNPLSALTPGFLRGIFGLGQGAAQGGPQSPPMQYSPQE